MTDDRRPPPDPVRAAIGANVRAEMARKGINQVQVARVIGCSQPQVSERIAGYVDFGARELVQIAELLGIPADRFMDDVTPASAP